MFYLIYLFSGLILTCNYVNSFENPQKISWICGDKNCDTPLSEIVTTTKHLTPNHKFKLTFHAREVGKVYKKPLNENGYDHWFVEIGGKKGYVYKDYVRETKVLFTGNTVQLEEDDPLRTEASTDTNDINPSPPQSTVVEGTTIYMNDVESTKSMSSNSDGVTPPLSSNYISENAQDSPKSAQSDSVDNTKTENIDYSKNYVNSPGTGSYDPIEYFDDDDDGKVEVEVEDEDEEEVLAIAVPSQSISTNSTSREQTYSKINSNGPGHETSQNQNDHLTESQFVEVKNVGETGSDTVNSTQAQPLPESFKPVETSTVTPPPIQKDSSLNNQNSAGNADLHNPSSQAESAENFVHQGTSPEHYNQRSTDSPININQETYRNDNQETANSRHVRHGKTESSDNTHQGQTGPDMDNKTNTTNSQDNIQNISVDNNQETTSSLHLNQGSTDSPINNNQESTQLYGNYKQETASSGHEHQVITESSINTHHGQIEPTMDTMTKANNSQDNIQNISIDNNQETTSSVHLNQGSADSPINNNQESTQLYGNYKQETASSGHEHQGIIESSINTHHGQIEPTVDNMTKANNYQDNIHNISVNNNLSTDTSNQSDQITMESSPNDKVIKASEKAPYDLTNSDKPVDNLSDGSFKHPSKMHMSVDHPQSERAEVTTPEYQNEIPSSIQEIPLQDSVIENSTPQDKQEYDYMQNVETNAETHMNPNDDGNESSNFYSPISSFFSYFKELFAKSELPMEHNALPSAADNTEVGSIETSTPTAPHGYCYDGDTCGGLERPIGGEDQPASFFSINKPYKNMDVFGKNAVPLSFNSIIYICITSIVLLLFSLGYYYIEKFQSSSYLVEKVNKLSHDLFITQKERDTLEDQLVKVKENCNMMDSSKLKQDSKMALLQNALEESESARTQLEETVVRLEKEVETLMEQGMEMHTLLSDTISDEDRSQMLLANIDELKESLGQKLNEIVTLTNQLDKKNEEIQLMQIDVRNANDRVNDLERKLESCKAETEEMFAKKLQDHQQQIIKLQQLLEEKGVSVAKLESELARTKVERDSAEARASSAETGLQAAHSVGAGEARQAWLDATSVRAALVTANESNKTLQQNIVDITSNNKILQEKIYSLSKEIDSLNSRYESVEKEKVNAFTKLQVLSDYFKEKESKLQEELGMKESLWLQKETEDHTIYEQMKSLREEISSYKAQNEKLKAEILEQEASYKVQVANEEQKSYDNWVALRQAERKVKELQIESAHFRNRLTQLEAANHQSVTEALNPNGLDKGSFGAPSPPFMMLPPPPHSEFFPLPPPPIHPSASRPPPLGRISSPQLSGEMFPPPPLVPLMLPNNSTPPPSLPMYKPQPRERPPPKDSPPSNYSSESVNEKAPRRRRR